MSRADQIIAEAEASAAKFPGAGLAYQVGWLRGEVRALCAELEGPPAHRGALTTVLTLGDAEVRVEYELERRRPGNWNNPTEPASVALIGVLLNGVWCNPEDVIQADTLERWREELAEASEESDDGPDDDDDYPEPSDARSADWWSDREPVERETA